MKRLLTLIAVLSTGMVQAQWLTQSADSKGSFLFKGSNVTFDIAKTDITLNLNNLYKPVELRAGALNHRFIYGLNVNAKNEDGTAALISSGDFNASGSFNVYAGFQWSNMNNEMYEEAKSKINKKIVATTNFQLADFPKKARKIVQNKVGASALPTAKAQQIITDWNKFLDTSTPPQFLSNVGAYADQGDPIIKQLKTDVIQESQLIIDKYAKQTQKLLNQLSQLKQTADDEDLWKLTLFGLQGIDASSFKRIDTINHANFSKSFISESFRGNRTGIGINYQRNRWRFGLSYAYRITNNLGDLKKKDYKVTSTTVSGSQTLTQETTYSAYSGSYAEVELMELNLDAIYTVFLGEESNTYALVNPYYRGNLYSRNQAVLPSNYSAGLGFYFFNKKAKFLGGFYMEVPDLDNAIAKSVPVADQNIRPALQKLTFGIVGKFSLSSLMGDQ